MTTFVSKVISRERAVLTLWCALVSQEDTAPGIHDTLAKGNNVVKHVERNIVASSDIRCLLEYLSDDWQVCVEVGSDSLGNVAKCFQN